MRRLHVAALAAAFVLAPAALVACGSDDESEDEDDITAVIERSATTTDPASCTEDQTQNFLEQTSGETGPAAVEQCEKDQEEEPAAESVETSEIEIDGDTATAVVAFTGGFIGGQSLDVGLVMEDDQWKLDELVGFAEFDRAAFVDTLVQGVTEDAGPDAAQAVACIRTELEGVADADLQAVFIESDETLFEETLAPCFEGQGGGSDSGGAEDTGTATEPEGTATEEETTTP